MIHVIIEHKGAQKNNIALDRNSQLYFCLSDVSCINNLLARTFIAMAQRNSKMDFSFRRLSEALGNMDFR